MKIHLDAIYEFYDPHPGFAGAMIPIPKLVKKVADELAEKKIMRLGTAVEKIKAVTAGEVGIKDGWISLKIGRGVYTHMFRVIRFK